MLFSEMLDVDCALFGIKMFDDLNKEHKLATIAVHTTLRLVCKVYIRFHYKLAVNIPNSLNIHIFCIHKQADKHTERQSNHSPLAVHACTTG